MEKGIHSGSHMGSIEYSPRWKKKIARIKRNMKEIVVNVLPLKLVKKKLKN